MFIGIKDLYSVLKVSIRIKTDRSFDLNPTSEPFSCFSSYTYLLDKKAIAKEEALNLFSLILYYRFPFLKPRVY